MIDKLIAMAFVACNPRKNPAARLVGQCASQAFDSTAKFVDALFTPNEDPVRHASQTYVSSGTSAPRLQVAKIPHCKMPDYTAAVRGVVDGLSRDYFEQKASVDRTREQIDLHERIDLAQQDREIKTVQGEIEHCQSDEVLLDRQRRAYRSEGILRNVFVHGIAQCLLSHQMSRLREKKDSLVSKQAELEALTEKRKTFDFTANRALLEEQGEVLESILRNYQFQKTQLDDFDRQMKSFVDQVSETVRLINQAIDRYNLLGQYEAELDAASNSYERRLVHMKCEETFGDGAVGRLRGQTRSRIKDLSARWVAQNQMAERHAREIGLRA